MSLYPTRLTEKLKEAWKAVLPIIGIVLLLSFTIAPVPPGILLLFLLGRCFWWPALFSPCR